MKYSNFLRLSTIFLITSSLLEASSAYESIKIGDFSLGGALRANYVQDSSKTDTANASKGSQGVFDLDMARINVDYKKDNILGKFEYRWYPGFGNTQNGTNYSFIHTLWVGYDFDSTTQIQVGINRVPFGATAYATSNSWFFDQHHYVGLSDDMDLGIKLTGEFNNFKYVLAYYPKSEPDGIGAGGESTRYAYDVVDDFHEKDQLSARLMYVSEMWVKNKNTVYRYFIQILKLRMSV
ncbi:porin [Sulfurimonas sp.]|uniref:porin n=1 Tax=Sulfurimonas sp. TaxID=2022749 RepID=UPI003564DBA4